MTHSFTEIALSKLSRVLITCVLIFSFAFRTNACSPIPIPTVVNYSLVGTVLSLTLTGSSTFNTCSNVMDVEIACNSVAFSGLGAATWTSAPFVPSSPVPYTVPTFTIDLSALCSGSVYKFRVRERNNLSATASPWTSTFTFTTGGVAVQPVLNITANPNIVCPPAINQLSASVNNICGGNTVSYTWTPATGLSNSHIANPVATLTASTTYTCYASGGQLGCWTASNVISLNLGSNPASGGVVSVSPSNICIGKTSTLSVTGFVGSTQWQTSSSAGGPWTNITGATNPSYVTPAIFSQTCYQVKAISCGASTSATSNVVCVTPNSPPTLSPVADCNGTLSTATYSYSGLSGAPSSVTWSPPPLSTSGNTYAVFSSPSPVNFTVSFPDGCLSTSSVNLPPPDITFTTAAVSCSSLGSATATPVNMASGPFVYFWSSLTQTTSVVSGIFPGNYTVSVSYNNGNCVYTTTTSIGSTTVFTGTVSSTPSVGCNGAGTGTAAITISGGTGNYNYSWTSGSNSATVSGLYAGTYAVTVSDAVTFCSTNQTFTITQPPPLSLTTSAVSSTACAGKSTTVSASASGGTPGGGPGYTYSWASGPSTTSFAVSQPIAGQYGYNVTASDANNCTITAVQFINFIQNPVITVANASICPQQSGVLIASGANTYTWTGGAVSNGSFSASPATTTTYTLIGTAQSCTSSGSGTIVVKPVPTPTISTNTPVCNGQVLLLTAGGGSTYKWQGPASYTSTLQNPTVNPVPVTLSGVFTVIATAANSCTAAVTSSVTVYPSPTISASGSTVCSSQTLQLTANSAAGSTYTWVGPGYSSTQQNPSIPHPLAGYSGNFSVYVTSAQGCTNIATTNVTVTEMPQLFPASNSPRCSGQNLNFSVNNINGGSYSWNGPNAFISGLQSPQINSVSVQAGGLYTLFVNLGPCLASTVIPAIVNALPVPTVSSNSPVCETKSLVLGVSCPNINTYFWSGPLGFTDHTPNTGRDSCALTFAGNYTIIVTDNNHCSSFATTNVIINRNPIVTATGATVCYKDPALLKGDGAVSYSWYTPAGLYSNQTNAVIAQALNVSPVVYTVIGTALNTCTSSATCTLQTTPLPQPSIKVFPSNKQCLNQVFTLQGSGAYSYDWVGPNRFQFAGTTVSLIASNLAFSGIYTLTAKDLRGCHAMTTTSLQVYPLPGGELDGVINSCAPFQSTFQFYPSALSASITNTSWYINSNPLFNDINHFSYTFNSPGNYVIKGSFTDLNSCVNTVSYVVTAYGQPVANFTFSPETPVETIDDVLFQNTSQGNIKKLSWFYGDNILTDKNKEVTSHLFDDAGTYPIALVVENEFGCLDSIVKPIVIAEDFHLFVPDVFSPNGDGLNDVFIPVTRGIKFYNLQIFDRWGIKIFETPNREVGWDGTTHGKISPEGVYVWRIEVSSRGGEQKTLTGHITLYR